MESSSMLLHYGDVVMLSCQLTSVDRLHAGLEEDNGFVFSAATSERRADDSVFLGVPQQSASATSASEQVRPPQNLRECRFVVFPKLLYMAQRDLLLCKNTTNSTSPGSARSEKLQAVRDEQRINETEWITKRGDPVKYGVEIQLKHEASGQFVGVEKTRGREKASMRVSIHASGGDENCWFTLNPGIRNRQFNESVSMHDYCILGVSSLPGQFLHTSTLEVNTYFHTHQDEHGDSGGGGGDHRLVYEVNTSQEHSQYLILPVASCEQTQHSVMTSSTGSSVAAGLVRGDDVFTIFCRESESFLSYETHSAAAACHLADANHGDTRTRVAVPRFQKISLSHRSSADALSHVCNSNHIWKIESQDLSWCGRVVSPSVHYRIQHVASGLYLASAIAGLQEMPPSAASLVLVANDVSFSGMDDCTLWLLAPERAAPAHEASGGSGERDDSAGKADPLVSYVSYDQLVHLQNKAMVNLRMLNSFLACQVQHAAAEAAEAEEDDADLVAEEPHAHQWRKDTVKAELRKERPQDAMELCKVSANVSDIAQMRMAARAVDMFLAELASTVVAITPAELASKGADAIRECGVLEVVEQHFDKMSHMLSVFCFDLNRDVANEQRLQRLLLEQRIIFKVVDIVRVLFQEKGIDPALLAGYAEFVPVFDIAKHCYEFLAVAIKGSQANRNALSQPSSLQMFMDQLVGSMRVGAMLYEMYHENADLLSRVESKHIDTFISMAIKQERVRYLRILCSLCENGPDHLLLNQTRIAERLFAFGGGVVEQIFMRVEQRVVFDAESVGEEVGYWQLKGLGEDSRVTFHGAEYDVSWLQPPVGYQKKKQIIMSVESKPGGVIVIEDGSMFKNISTTLLHPRKEGRKEKKGFFPIDLCEESYRNYSAQQYSASETPQQVKVRFYFETLTLLSKLCSGRNGSTATMIRNWHKYLGCALDDLGCIIMSDVLPNEQRQLCTDLARSLYLIQDPNVIVPILSYTRLCFEPKVRSEQMDKVAGPPMQMTSLDGAHLVHMALGLLEEKCSLLQFKDKSMLLFLQSLLTLVTDLMQHGFFHQIQSDRHLGRSMAFSMAGLTPEWDSVERLALVLVTCLEDDVSETAFAKHKAQVKAEESAKKSNRNKRSSMAHLQQAMKAAQVAAMTRTMLEAGRRSSVLKSNSNARVTVSTAVKREEEEGVVERMQALDMKAIALNLLQNVLDMHQNEKVSTLVVFFSTAFDNAFPHADEIIHTDREASKKSLLDALEADLVEPTPAVTRKLRSKSSIIPSPATFEPTSPLDTVVKAQDLLIAIDSDGEVPSRFSLLGEDVDIPFLFGAGSGHSSMELFESMESIYNPTRLAALLLDLMCSQHSLVALKAYVVLSQYCVQRANFIKNVLSVQLISDPYLSDVFVQSQVLFETLQRDMGKIASALHVDRKAGLASCYKCLSQLCGWLDGCFSKRLRTECQNVMRHLGLDSIVALLQLPVPHAIDPDKASFNHVTDVIDIWKMREQKSWPSSHAVLNADEDSARFALGAKAYEFSSSFCVDNEPNQDLIWENHLIKIDTFVRHMRHPQLASHVAACFKNVVAGRPGIISHCISTNFVALVLSQMTDMASDGWTSAELYSRLQYLRLLDHLLTGMGQSNARLQEHMMTDLGKADSLLLFHDENSSLENPCQELNDTLKQVNDTDFNLAGTQLSTPAVLLHCHIVSVRILSKLAKGSGTQAEVQVQAMMPLKLVIASILDLKGPLKAKEQVRSAYLLLIREAFIWSTSEAVIAFIHDEEEVQFWSASSSKSSVMGFLRDTAQDFIRTESPTVQNAKTVHLPPVTTSPNQAVSSSDGNATPSSSQNADEVGPPSHSFVYDSILPTLLAYCDNYSKWMKSRDLEDLEDHREFWPAVANVMPKLARRASSLEEKSMVARLSQLVMDLFHCKRQSVFGLGVDSNIDNTSDVKEDARSITCQAHAIMWRHFGKQFAGRVGVLDSDRLMGQGQLQLAVMLCRNDVLTRVETDNDVLTRVETDNVMFQEVQWHLARLTRNPSLQDAAFQHSGAHASMLRLMRLCFSIDDPNNPQGDQLEKFLNAPHVVQQNPGLDHMYESWTRYINSMRPIKTEPHGPILSHTCSRYNALGFSIAALNSVCSTNSEVKLAALRLLMDMLVKGQRDVQDTIYLFLRDHRFEGFATALEDILSQALTRLAEYPRALNHASEELKANLRQKAKKELALRETELRVNFKAGRRVSTVQRKFKANQRMSAVQRQTSCSADSFAPDVMPALSRKHSTSGRDSSAEDNELALAYKRVVPPLDALFGRDTPIMEVLHIIEYLCEGHHFMLQHYLGTGDFADEIHYNSRKFNLLDAMSLLLEQLQPSVRQGLQYGDRDPALLAMQICRTLSEACQGTTFNQEMLVSSRLPVTIDRFFAALRFTDPDSSHDDENTVMDDQPFFTQSAFPWIDQDDANKAHLRSTNQYKLDLKRSLLDLCISILEGIQDNTKAGRMVDMLQLDNILTHIQEDFSLLVPGYLSRRSQKRNVKSKHIEVDDSVLLQREQDVDNRIRTSLGCVKGRPDTLKDVEEEIQRFWFLFKHILANNDDDDEHSREVHHIFQTFCAAHPQIVSYMNAETDTVEVVYDGDVERVFFPQSSMMKLVRATKRVETMQAIYPNVRDNPTEKVSDILSAMKAVQKSFIWTMQLQKTHIGRWCVAIAQHSARSYITAGLEITVLVLVLLFWQRWYSEGDTASTLASSTDYSARQTVAIYEFPIIGDIVQWLTYLHTVVTLCGYVCFLVVKRPFPEVVRDDENGSADAFLTSESERWLEIRNIVDSFVGPLPFPHAIVTAKASAAFSVDDAENAGSSGSSCSYVFIFLHEALSTSIHIEELLRLLCSFAASASNPFFMFISLIILRFDTKSVLVVALQRALPPTIKYLLTAVGLAACFGACSYCFFLSEMPPDTCTNPLQCIGHHIAGLQHEGMLGLYGVDKAFFFLHSYHDLMDSSKMKQFGLASLIFFYFICWAVVLQGIIMGQIVDAFAQIRDLEEQNKQDLKDNCLVCSLPRTRFESQKISFTQHVHQHHNLLAYLSYLIYIQAKDPIDYTGLESEVNEKIENDNASFFPVEQSLQLMIAENSSGDSKVESEHIGGQISTRLKTLEDRFDTIDSTMKTKFDAIEQGLAGITALLAGPDHASGTPVLHRGASSRF